MLVLVPGTGQKHFSFFRTATNQECVAKNRDRTNTNREGTVTNRDWIGNLSVDFTRVLFYKLFVIIRNCSRNDTLILAISMSYRAVFVLRVTIF